MLICARDSKLGRTIEQEYIDRASGKTADRQQLKRMFDHASKRKVV